MPESSSELALDAGIVDARKSLVSFQAFQAVSMIYVYRVSRLVYVLNIMCNINNLLSNRGCDAVYQDKSTYKTLTD